MPAMRSTAAADNPGNGSADNSGDGSNADGSGGLGAIADGVVQSADGLLGDVVGAATASWRAAFTPAGVSSIRP